MSITDIVAQACHEKLIILQGWELLFTWVWAGGLPVALVTDSATVGGAPMKFPLQMAAPRAQRSSYINKGTATDRTWVQYPSGGY